MNYLFSILALFCTLNQLVCYADQNGRNAIDESLYKYSGGTQLNTNDLSKYNKYRYLIEYLYNQKTKSNYGYISKFTNAEYQANGNGDVDTIDFTLIQTDCKTEEIVKLKENHYNCNFEQIKVILFIN